MREGDSSDCMNKTRMKGSYALRRSLIRRWGMEYDLHEHSEAKKVLVHLGTQIGSGI